MATNHEFIAFLHEVFESFGPIQAQRMFGGYGIYHDGLMFGLVVAHQLYLKTDAVNRADFEDLGLGAFTYEMKGKPVQLSYHQAPEALFDERHLAARWARRSWDAALRAQAVKAQQAERAKSRQRTRSGVVSGH
ncbi:MAG: TfoX/Sxy family protein [Limnohabitans sp.]|jgi:DNA transformation protein and related proteins|nr:TfoX/Sxy family protein [Limnohabitans sp.]MDP4771597.1 TfoX/Sxy family protein [Limnohabitans sp.]MDP4923070.1 TfoX/Sxy family protein [Limnohabitans sp.]